jgi:CheY-like chemotaxis protein
VSWREPAKREARLRGQCILVVEDEPLVAIELCSLLADAGAEVVGPGKDLPEISRLAHEAALSAALLDVRLGGGTVAPVARILQERGVPFAFYTGQIESDAVRREWPSAPLIVKPAPAVQLVAAVARLHGA